MHRVVVPVSPGTPLFELAVPCEVFGIDRTDIAPDWYDFALCQVGPGPTALPHGLVLTAAAGLEGVVSAGTVIVPAWPGPGETEPPGELLEALREAHRRGARIASICSGAFVLAAAGLLDGRRATTHWRYSQALAARHPRVHVDRDVLYVDEGDVLTSAGTAAGLDLCLHIVRADHGTRVAAEVARRLVVPPHRDGGQAQYVRAPLPDKDGTDGTDGGIGAVMAWAVAHLDRPLTVDDLSRRALMTPRTFARAFVNATGTSPIQWLNRQRIAAAQELLESTDLSVEQVAVRVGFGSAVSLRARFTAVAGVPPSRYRRTFTGATS